MNLTYTVNVPDAPNNPSVDQPIMETNNNSNLTLWTLDHFGFNDNKGGFHQQATMFNKAAPGFPHGGDGIYHVNTFQGNTWPYFQNALGDFLLLSGPTFASQNGFSFISQGMLLNWGLKTGLTMGSGASNVVTFAKPFPTVGSPFSILVTPLRIATSNADTLYVLTGSVTQTGFTIVNTSSSITSAYFFAIGN